MSSLTVVPVTGRRGLSDFIAFPYSLYRRDPLWAPALRRDTRRMLSPKNPFFEHAEAWYFLALRRGDVAGRIAAIHNRRHNEFQGDRVGFFGFFEAVDDASVARALFDAAGEWLLARGLTVMRGPASFSMNDEVGLLLDGFDTPPTLMMPHNPPYYPALLEACGFVKAKDLLVYQSTADHLPARLVEGANLLPARLVEGANLLQRRYGITTRSLEMKRFEEEVSLIKRLYNAAWERNWGFVPMTDQEIDHLAEQLKPVIVPEIVPFAERKGEAIGVAAAVPDLNVALKANPSGRLFPGILKVLWAARKITRIRVLLLGTLPEWRGKGVDALLYKHIWEEGYRKGYRWAEAGWILEDNHPMRNGLVRMGLDVYKTYRVYDRPL